MEKNRMRSLSYPICKNKFLMNEIPLNAKLLNFKIEENVGEHVYDIWGGKIP